MTIRLTGILRKKQIGSKEQRNKILNSWTNFSILAGDIMNSGEMEEVKRLEKKARELMKRLQECCVEVKEWRKKYEILEDKKKKLFEELTDEILNSQDKRKISSLEAENEELKKICKKIRETAK